MSDVTREAPIVRKTANLLVRDAELTRPAHWLGAYATLAISPRLVSRMSKAMGGLWVGGNIELFNDRLKFSANWLNAKVQSGSLDFQINVSAITGVHLDRGFLTDIIVIRAEDRIYKLRCYGANALLSKIEQVVGRSRDFTSSR